MNDHILSEELIAHVKKKLFDIPYAGESLSQVLDIWYPNEPGIQPLPTIVHFHGGGFAKGGHREDSLEPMLRGLDYGYIVVSVEYRKSEEAHFPAMLYDAKAAVRFLKAHADEYQIDTGKIALWGPSAGGWIAAMTALTAGNPAFEAVEMGNGAFDSSVAAVVDWCGPCGSFLKMDEALKKSGAGVPNHNTAHSCESQFLGVPLPKVNELVRLANPCTYVNPAMPPFLIMHGVKDAVVPVEQSYEFAEAIQNAVGEDRVELVIDEEAPHHGRIWWHEVQVSDRVFEFLHRVLRN